MKKRPNFKILQQLNPEAVHTRAETADLLGMTTAGIAQRIRRGLLPAFKIGGTWYIRGADIQDQVFTPAAVGEGDPEALL
jgi:hypothetical protein